MSGSRAARATCCEIGRLGVAKRSSPRLRASPDEPSVPCPPCPPCPGVPALQCSLRETHTQRERGLRDGSIGRLECSGRCRGCQQTFMDVVPSVDPATPLHHDGPQLPKAIPLSGRSGTRGARCNHTFLLPVRLHTCGKPGETMLRREPG